MYHSPHSRYPARMFSLPSDALATFRRLNTPRKIQDFLETIPANPEPDGDTCFAPLAVLRERRAHCIEAAMLAALALRVNGDLPLVVDLESSPHDQDHVITVFKRDGYWGTISKSNHAVLRYREPVYRTLRELVMSYFHEYTDNDGRKTLRTFSKPVDLSRFDKQGWMTETNEAWYIADYLCDIPHEQILTRKQIATLRRADPIEQEAGKILQWKP